MTASYQETWKEGKANLARKYIKTKALFKEGLIFGMIFAVENCFKFSF